MRKQPLCPACGKELEIMYAEENKDKNFDCLLSCELCINGVPSDWSAVYSPQNGYTNFERHFWG